MWGALFDDEEEAERAERQRRAAEDDERRWLLANYAEGNHNDIQSDMTSTLSFHWTKCDECKRCVCVVSSFVFMVALVGTGLVTYWFLWAWFVLKLHVPGILTPILWLMGFLAPIFFVRVFGFLPQCTRGCCAPQLKPPDVNSWKTNHLWSVRQLHVEAIGESIPQFPTSLVELVAEFSFHHELLVAASKRNLIGIYPDSAEVHTLCEFSSEVTDIAVPNGNVRSVFVLVRRELDSAAQECQEDLELMMGDSDDDEEERTLHFGFQRQRAPWWSFYSAKEQIDMMVCEYDLVTGTMTRKSDVFVFEQISNTTLQQLVGIQYSPSYRMLYDAAHNRIVVFRDGEFVLMDPVLGLLSRRELILQPDTANDRDQFIHLTEFRWHAATIVPTKVAKKIMRIVDESEGTNSIEFMNEDHVYVCVPYAEHTLFVGNINDGWIRYLDFGIVEHVGESHIEYVDFSSCGTYMYLVLNRSICLLSTTTFAPLLNVDYIELEHVIPCGLVRTIPVLTREQQQRLEEEERRSRARALRAALDNNDSGVEIDGKALDNIMTRAQAERCLESLNLLLVSDRQYMDPRLFVYRFPQRKMRVVTQKKRKRRLLYEGGWMIDQALFSMRPSWHLVTMKRNAWNQVSRYGATRGKKSLANEKEYKRGVFVRTHA